MQAAEAIAAKALVDLQRGRACSREDYQLQEARGGQGSSASRATQQDSISPAGFTLADDGDRGGCASPLTLQGPSTPSRPLGTSLTTLSSRQTSSASSSVGKKRKSPFTAQANNLLSYFQLRPVVSTPALPGTPKQGHQPLLSG